MSETLIGLLHPGEMGAAVAGCLTGRGYQVLWVPAGRGPAAQHRFSADPFAVDVDHGGAGSVAFIVWDALAYALVRPGRVVVRLVLGQDGTQMSLAEDQHAIQELSAQGAWPCARRSGSCAAPDGSAQNPGAGGLEDGVERGGEVRSAVSNHGT